MNTGNATCKNFYAGCQCRAITNTCGPRAELCCEADCRGSFDMPAGKATCQGGFFKGCECLATDKTCGAQASCDANNCQGSFDLEHGKRRPARTGSQAASARPRPTLRAALSCDMNSTVVARPFDLFHGQGNLQELLPRLAECAATSSTCGPPSSAVT